MSIVAPHPETRVVLSNVSWVTFEALVAEADQHGTRFAYDRGILEIMSPSKEHEWYHRLLGRLVEAYTLERNIPIQSTGATTLKAQLKDCGLEPGGSYYIAHESLVRGCDDLDLARTRRPIWRLKWRYRAVPLTSWRSMAIWGCRKFGSTTANPCGCACGNPMEPTKQRLAAPCCRSSRRRYWRASLPGGTRATKRPGFARFTSG